MKRIWIIVPLLLILFVCSCSKSHDPYLSRQIGKTCTVQFKRNSLGSGAALPVSPMTDNINGADVALSGTLQTVEDHAIIVVSGNKTCWIPRDSILLIESAK
jgi:hypothetical protein